MPLINSNIHSTYSYHNSFFTHNITVQVLNKAEKNTTKLFFFCHNNPALKFRHIPKISPCSHLLIITTQTQIKKQHKPKSRNNPNQKPNKFLKKSTTDDTHQHAYDLEAAQT